MAATPSKWRPVWELALTFLVVLVCGLIGIVSFMVDMVRKGPSRMFHVRPRNTRPAVLDNPDFGTHQFITLKDKAVKLHCVVNGSSDKPLMVFAHGFPEFWYSWRHQLKEFSKNYRVAAYDLRGYGETEAPLDISGYTLDQMGDDLEQLITALGYESCTVVGHDWGGAAAFSLAAMHPHRVQKLVILNAPHMIAFFSYVKRHVGQIRKLWHMMLFQLPVFPRLMVCADDYKWPEKTFCDKPIGAKQGTFSRDDIEAFKYSFYHYGDWSACLQMFRAAFRYATPKIESATAQGKINVPTLIIWGTEDGAVDIELAELSSRYVHQCTIRYIEGASHWVQQEEPERVNQLIHQFMDDKLC